MVKLYMDKILRLDLGMKGKFLILFIFNVADFLLNKILR